MTEADLDLARDHARQHQEQGRSGEYSNQLNWNFHAALYAPSGRKATIELVGRIYQQQERYTRMMVTLTEIHAQSDRDHWQLVELCEARDTLRAVGLLEGHIISSGKYLVDRLQELREAGSAGSAGDGKTVDPGGDAAIRLDSRQAGRGARAAR
jgi:DNA-binding GntR family transcriptional regulator